MAGGRSRAGWNCGSTRPFCLGGATRTYFLSWVISWGKLQRTRIGNYHGDTFAGECPYGNLFAIP